MKAIYTITNAVTNKSYVGSTKDYDKRKKRHLTELRKGCHHSVYLQRSFDKHGEAAFVFSILKELTDACDQFVEELAAITELQPAYNVGSVGGGDNLTNNPNRVVIIQKMTDSLSKRYAAMSSSDKKAMFGKPGAANRNWKGGHKYFCACGAKIAGNNKSCFACKPIHGEDNPFFGKTHSDATKQKIRDAGIGRLPPNTKQVMVEGIVYASMTSAAKHYGVVAATMKYRVDSTSEKWKDFYLV